MGVGVEDNFSPNFYNFFVKSGFTDIRHLYNLPFLYVFSVGVYSFFTLRPIGKSPAVEPWQK